MSNVFFSLVVATYGRSNEVDELLDSLLKQDIGLDKFEVIIVDQNDVIDLESVVKKYSDLLIIKHIRSGKKGLSYNRNVGISIAVGDIVCFPDDDCKYYPDTLSRVAVVFHEQNVSTVFGAIRDRGTGKNIIRDWPGRKLKLTNSNFFFLCSSITVFAKNSGLYFNDILGAGCYFGSCEDTDFAYRQIHCGNAIYSPCIEVWHPDVGIESFSRQKNVSYGLGFGAFCRIYSNDIHILVLFIASLGFHFVKLIGGLVRMNWSDVVQRRDALYSRIKGFFEYGKLK